LLKVEMSDDGAREIALRSRGTPRIANRLLRRVRDFAEVTRRQGGPGIADAALKMLDVDKVGLDVMDRRMLLAIMEKFAGGPSAWTTWRRPLARSATPSKMARTLSDPAGLSAAHPAWTHATLLALTSISHHRCPRKPCA